MRVTNSEVMSNVLESVQNQYSALSLAQNQVSSGLAVQTPSDNPSAANQIMALNKELAANTQAQANAQNGQSWVNATDSQLQQAASILEQVQSLVTEAANSTNTQSQQDAIATQLQGLQAQLVTIANSQAPTGGGLFSGFASGAAVTQVGGAWTYTGDNGAVQRRVGPGQMVTVNVSGSQVFGFSAGAGKDVFSMLDQAINDVKTASPTTISNDISGVTTALGRVQAGLATTGAAGATITAALSAATSNALAIQTQLTSVQDVNLTTAAMNLNAQEVSYQAALGALSKVLGPSLLNFLPNN